MNFIRNLTLIKLLQIQMCSEEVHTFEDMAAAYVLTLKLNAWAAHFSILGLLCRLNSAFRPTLQQPTYKPLVKLN